MGSRFDIMFKIGQPDDKYLDDGLMKVPKTLRDTLAFFVQTNQRKANDLYTVGFIATV